MKSHFSNFGYCSYLGIEVVKYNIYCSYPKLGQILTIKKEKDQN